MRRHGLIGVVALTLLAWSAVPSHAQGVSQGTAFAGVPDQTPPPGQTSATSQTPRPSGQPSANSARGLAAPTQNVRVEITITDSFAGVAGGVAPGVSGGVVGGVSGGVPNAKKMVTMLIADGFSGSIRSANDVMTANGAVRTISINVDCTPTVRDNSKIQLSLTVQYSPELSMLSQVQNAPSGPRPASINESATFLVTDGRPIMVSQSADPATDRKVTIEVTATIVK